MKRQYPSLLFPGKTQIDESDVAIKVDGAELVIDSINPFSWRKAALSIADWHPDLVVIQWWHPFFSPAFGSIARLARRTVPVLFLCHNVIPHEKQGPVAALSRAALKWGDLFVVHSEEDMRNLRAILPESKVKTARHPTYEVFRYSEISREEARNALGIAQDTRLLLFFGLVRAYKGLKYLIEAMPKIREQVGAELLVAGEFYEGRTVYDALIQELGISQAVRVEDRYVPNEQVGLYFVASDVVVLPYVTATQSGIVQIAYGFERPVITTNVGGLPEVVRDGETGLLVPPADPDALADAVIKYFNDDLGETLTRGVREHKEEFSWERMVETIEDLAAGRTA
jgi:glycosyltransferase involved in cell wall biosynthesis